MTRVIFNGKGLKVIALTSFLMSVPVVMMAQGDLRIGVHASPLVSWFGSDNGNIISQGAKPGFNFGISANKYFSENYAVTFGIDLINAGGKLATNSDSFFTLKSKESTTTTPVLAGKTITYNIQYLAIPIGLKLQTTQIGYVSFFTNIGIDPKVVIGGKASIPAQNDGITITPKIDKQNAMAELKPFNLGYHVTIGAEYGVGGNTVLVFGVGYENNFLDITKDLSGQIKDKIKQNMLSLQLGVIF